MQNERRFPTVVHLAGVVILSTTLLAIGIERAGVASPFSDPVARIRAQDESSYVSSAVHLATEGGWLTPRVLGRYFLYKPPLLVWLAGLSIKLFGIALWSVRLPALAAAVFATTVLIWWTRAARSAVVAWSTALLLLSDPLWHIFARLCYTDMLLVASTTGAMASLYRDRTLSRTSSFWGFALCTAAGVMAKNVAGVVPVLVVLLYYVLAPQNERPQLSRIVAVTAATLALVAPWHFYQIVVHPKWFWADYVQVQLLGSGISPPGQMSVDGSVWYYLRRLSRVDPLLLLLTVLGLPSLLSAARRDKADTLARILVAWLVVTAVALLAFRFRNLPYALSLVPPIVLIAVTYGPFSIRHRPKFILVLLILAFGVKVALPQKTWGLSFGSAEGFPAAGALRTYTMLGRSTGLILVDADDYFYASTLPLPSVRYYFLDPVLNVQKSLPHYWYLGIVVSLEDFERLNQLRPTYALRLKAWGLDSTAPLATSIVSTSKDGVLRVARACPQADFYLPVQDLPLVQPIVGITHRIMLLANGRAFLLALNLPRNPSPGPKWILPDHW